MAYKQTDFKEFQSKRQQSIDAYFSASQRPILISLIFNLLSNNNKITEL